jgi:MFS family permease
VHKSTGRRSPRSAVVLAASSVTTSALPLAFTSGLVVQIRADLDLGLDLYGLLAAGYFFATASTSRLLGPSVERLGAGRSIRLAAFTTTVALVILGSATGPILLGAGLVVGGIANSFAHPAANRLLSKLVPPQQQGLAFGIKQASIPAATLVGGLAVPLVGLTIGWRWAFALGISATIAILVTPIAPAIAARPRLRDIAPSFRPERQDPAARSLRRTLLPLAVGGAFGAASSAPLKTFLVDAGVETGLHEATAGLLLATASAAGILARVLAGAAADRSVRVEPAQMITGMLIIGASGLVGLSIGTPLLFVAGALVGYAAGWSWNGLLHFAAVSRGAAAPATATSTVQTGLSFGAGVGPLLLGIIVANFGYPAGWLSMAALMLTAAAIIGSWARRTKAG